MEMHFRNFKWFVLKIIFKLIRKKRVGGASKAVESCLGKLSLFLAFSLYLPLGPHSITLALTIEYAYPITFLVNLLQKHNF